MPAVAPSSMFGELLRPRVLASDESEPNTVFRFPKHEEGVVSGIDSNERVSYQDVAVLDRVRSEVAIVS